MELIYRTKNGDKNVQGRQKVFICSDPEDQDNFIDTISKDVFLQCGNVAIYNIRTCDYDAPVDCDQFLAEMQLMVLVMTGAMLKNKNKVVVEMINYALDKHVPILPIAVKHIEPQEASKLLGDLQYLDKTLEDKTAVAYEKKLKNFLDSVIINDETLEKIRDAFDAYLFLSYRKKDRQYSNEIMRLIHKNEFFRDVAIWFDEFIVPGENFNIEIQKAFEKSDAFVMVVTPNLLEENNYVMKTEYPMARDSKVSIVPIEAVKTNGDEIKKHFGGLSSCIKIEEQELLAETLHKILDKKINLSHKETPEHVFLMGLAYLNGIDVEIDYSHALSLIKNAANRGLPEAYLKLSSMYKNGEGVERSYNESVQWQKKLADLYEEKQDFISLINLQYSLIEEMYEIGDMEHIGYYGLRLKYYLSCYEDIIEDEHDKANVLANSAYAQLLCSRYSGKQDSVENDIKEALEKYKKAIALDEKIGTPNSKYNIFEMAAAAEYKNKFQTSKQYVFAEEYAKKMLEAARQLNHIEPIINSYIFLYDINLESNKTEKAAEFLNEALNLIKYYEMNNKEDIRYLKYYVYFKVAEFLIFTKQYLEALSYLWDSVDVCDELLQDSYSLNLQKNKLKCYNYIAEINRWCDDKVAQQEALKNAKDIAEQIYKLTDDENYNPCNY